MVVIGEEIIVRRTLSSASMQMGPKMPCAETSATMKSHTPSCTALLATTRSAFCLSVKQARHV